ncbi:MAG: glucose-6-phosphate dehydrogenase [Candidatus Wallbacteria bacterium]
MNENSYTPGAGASCIIVIFGITGDLAQKKIIPAIYNLYCLGLLNEKTHIVGVGRRQYEAGEYSEYLNASIEAASEKRSFCLVNERTRSEFISLNSYLPCDFSRLESYSFIRESLKKIAVDHKICNFLYYLSTPPQNFIEIISNIGASGLSKPDFLDISCAGSFVRVVIEKPYGNDYNSARDLNEKILSIFSENQVYRIDHYLGKETVQNIMVLRFLNNIFEPVWNQKYIDNVEIKVYESGGIGKRANYFDKTGIIRDIIQNHSLQMLSLLAMEPTISMAPEDVRNEKLKVLSAIRPFDCQNPESQIVAGQYGKGNAAGKPVSSYLDEPGVTPGSRTETFAAIKLFIDNWRFSGVPFYLVAGKRMPERVAEAVVTFKPVPHLIFRNMCCRKDILPNKLIIRIQPDEGISLKIFSKTPGFGMDLRPITLGFNYAANNEIMPEPYERLILDASNGDSALFMRSDEIEAAWKYITPITECLKEGRIELKKYKANGEIPDFKSLVCSNNQ